MRYAPRYPFVTVKTHDLISKEIAVARISARRAARAVAIFSTWLLVTWLGPDVLPSEGWSIWVSVGALAGYSLLTVSALVAVYMGALRVVRTGVMRRVVSTYLAPFWGVAFAALCTGAFLWTAIDDPIVAVWLSIGSTLTVLSAAYAVARFLEVRELLSSQRQIAHAPSDVVMRTWKRELVARLDAARSIRLPRTDT